MANGTQDIDVRYLNRDFTSIQERLINFAEAYYPDTIQDFSEGSVGLLYIDMAAFVGDVLSFYTDVQFKEGFIQYADERENVWDLANELGYRPNVTEPATTTLDVFAVVPTKEENGTVQPDFSLAPAVRENMVVSSESRPDVRFRTLEDVNFAVDTPERPREVRIFERDPTDQSPASFLVTKKVRASAGTIESTTFDFSDPEPFPKREFPDNDVITILNVVDAEGNEWFEVPYLAQERVFTEFRNRARIDSNLSRFSDEVPFLIDVRREEKRFIRRTESDGTTFIQFGSGVARNSEDLIPDATTIGNPELPSIDQLDLPIDPANFMSTDSFGRVPFDTSLEVEYVVGGGTESNVPINDLTNIITVDFEFGPGDVDGIENQQIVQNIQNSVRVTNPIPATGGGPGETIDEIRRNAQAFFAAQNRAVTAEDYKTRVLSMPSRYGSVAKATVQPDTNRNNPLGINLHVLGFNSSGKLVPVNDAIKENIKEFLSQFRMFTDGVSIRDGFAINFAINFEISVGPTFSSRQTKFRAIRRLQDLLSVEKMDFGDPLVTSSLVNELRGVEGVQSVRDFDIENRFDTNEDYSGNRYDIERATRRGVVFPPQDPAIFELRFPDKDITGSVV